MVRAMCGVKLMDRKNTKELMGELGLHFTRYGREVGKSKWGTLIRACFEKG